VAGATNLDLSGGVFEAELGSLDPAGTYLLYCRSGNRSAQAAQLMAEAGFTSVYDMGGFADWQAAGGAVATG
jgi:rhodanese-related sulfurtransferase